jgi:hypothetical protein
MWQLATFTNNRLSFFTASRFTDVVKEAKSDGG